ncbi:MAG: hypothetical protein K0Q93_2684 [Nocardioidaceae bacterium]|nr:hypothetical protein [Nocardioidaceae bacterium]
MILVGSIFAVVGLILGTVFVLVGSQDYSSYTARADATVVEVDVDISRNSSGEPTTRTSYDVEFVADGRTVRVDDIGGVRYGDYAAGEVVVVAFPPGQPRDAVWATTVEGGQRVMRYVGLGIGLLFGGLGAVILMLGLRRRPVSSVAPGVGVAEPVPEDPGAAADTGRPWTFDEVVGDLVRRTVGTPYAVDREGDSITVRVDLADAQWWALLQRHGLRKAYSITLTPIGPAKAARSDDLTEFEWVGGPDGRSVPRITGEAAWKGGRVWSVGAERIWAPGPDGLRKVVDYRLDSGELQELISTTLSRAGWKTAFDTQTRIGLWAGVVGAVGAVVALVVLFVL